MLHFRCARTYPPRHKAVRLAPALPPPTKLIEAKNPRVQKV